MDTKRIILKLSGEALGVDGRLFDYGLFVASAKALMKVQSQGYELAVVIGGGNIWRGRRGPAKAMGAVAADQMGMLATMQNVIMMHDALTSLGAKATVMSAVDMVRFATPFQAAKGKELLSQGHILLLGGGTGNPFFSTDSAVALRALELGCGQILMAKNVDGVYDKDPAQHADARLLTSLTYAQCLEKSLRAIDLNALILLMDNEFPCVRLFQLDAAGDNLLKVLAGDPMGTTLTP
ncbi:MAG TPA: UMP kinase [Candidatus Limiplasma sp.]|nr:UMP kinase [Candidatus Limiplasma sp.]